MKAIKKLSFLALLVLAAAGVSMSAHADTITWDQILYKLNPPGGLTEAQALNLDADIDMTFSPISSGPPPIGLLTVLLTNTSGDTTGTTANASNLLTGLGFNLPSGVTVNDTTYNSTVDVSPGSTLYNDPDNTLSPDDWGWRGNNTGGHFSSPNVLPVNLIVSTSSADVLQTFGGGNKNLVNGTDYGLTSATGSPGPAASAYIEDSVKFLIYLNMGIYTGNLLQYIQDGNVVVAYGSPADAQGQIPPDTGKVPEPVSLVLLGSGLVGCGILIRKKSKKQILREAV